MKIDVCITDLIKNAPVLREGWPASALPIQLFSNLDNRISLRPFFKEISYIQGKINIYADLCFVLTQFDQQKPSLFSAFSFSLNLVKLEALMLISD